MTNVTNLNTVIDPSPILMDLTKNLDDAKTCVHFIQALINEGTFSNLSKAARNNLTSKLMNSVSSVEDATKASLRQIKKIKRTKPEDYLVDQHLLRMATFVEDTFDLTSFIGNGGEVNPDESFEDSEDSENQETEIQQ